MLPPTTPSSAEDKSLASYYSGTFEALNNPWQNSNTNPFIDNPTAFGDFSDGHPAKMILALSLVEGLVAQITHDLREAAEARDKQIA